MTVETAYHTLYIFVLIVLAVLIGFMVVRSVIGPRVTDRILSVNMVGTMVICGIVISFLMLKEGYLIDVALIYGMISFLGVLTLAHIYIPDKPIRQMDYEEKLPGEAAPKKGSRKKRKGGRKK